MSRTTLNVSALAHHGVSGGSEEGGMMFWLLACKTAVPPAPPVQSGPPPIVLVDATTDELVPTPYTLVEVRADGTVSVDGALQPIVLPVTAPDSPGAPEIVAALEKAKLTHPDRPRVVVLVVDAAMDFHGVRQAIYSTNHAGCTAIYFATQADPADPLGSWRGIRVEQEVMREDWWAVLSQDDRSDALQRHPFALGALGKPLIDAVIKNHMDAITLCYQYALKRQPDNQGKVVVKFIIAPDGTVWRAEMKSTTMTHPDAEYDQCMVELFLGMKFPEPKGDGIVIVSYPFIVTPG
jgi:hypothetical protein